MLIDNAEVIVTFFFENEGAEGEFFVVVERVIELDGDMLVKRNAGGDENHVIFGRVAVDGQKMKLPPVNADGSESERCKRVVPGAADGQEVGFAGEAQDLGGVIRVNRIPLAHELLKDVESSRCH